MSREPFCEEFVAALVVMRAWTAPKDPDFEWRLWVHPGDDVLKRQESRAPERTDSMWRLHRRRLYVEARLTKNNMWPCWHKGVEL